MISTAAVHTMLLGFAGRIPDQLLTDLRFSLAQDVQLEIAYALVAIARRLAMPLTTAEHAMLTDIIAAHDEEVDLVARLPVTRAEPSMPFRFTAVARHTAAAHSTPDAIDLTGDWKSFAAIAEGLVDGVDATVMNAVGKHDSIVGVWRSWRYPDHSDSVEGVRIYLVEVRPQGQPTLLAAQIAAALQTVGAPAGPVEVYTTGDAVPPYLCAARTNSCLLWASSAGPTRIPLRYNRAELHFPADHPRLTKLDSLLHYLRNAPVLIDALENARDVVDPARGAVIPMTVRTDGQWLWPEAVAEYLGKYRLAPDPDFLTHLRTIGPPPSAINGVDLFRARLAAQRLPGLADRGPAALRRPNPLPPDRFAPVPADVLRVAWRQLPACLDLTAPTGLDDVLDLLVDQIDQQIIAMVRNERQTLGVWRCWRFPAHLPPDRAIRYYLIETEPTGRFDYAAERLQRAARHLLWRAGELDGRVAIFDANDKLGPIHTQVRAHGALLWARTPKPLGSVPSLLDRMRQFVTAPVPVDSVTQFRAEHTRRLPVAAFWNELRRTRAFIADIVPAPTPDHPVHLSALVYTGEHPPTEAFWPQLRQPDLDHRPVDTKRRSRLPPRRKDWWPSWIGTSTSRAGRARRTMANTLADTTVVLGSCWSVASGDLPPPRMIRRGWEQRAGRARAICAVSLGPAESLGLPAGWLSAVRAALTADGVKDLQFLSTSSSPGAQSALAGRIGRYSLELRVRQDPSAIRCTARGPWLKVAPEIEPTALSTVEHLLFAAATDGRW